MAQRQRTLRKDDLSILLEARKSAYPGYQRVNITFPDFYQSELNEVYGWSESAIDQFDVHLFGALNNLDAVVYWEDKEFFKVDMPSSDTWPLPGVYSSLESLLSTGPFSAEKVAELETQSRAAAEKAEGVRQSEVLKIRQDVTLFRGYKKNPLARFGHDGYCIVEMHKIRGTGALTYDESEFLGVDRKLVSRPGTVLLDVSISGRPFNDIYGKLVDYRQSYRSLAEEELLALAASADVSRKQHRIGTVSGDTEHLTFLCTKGFAERVSDYLNQRFPYLDSMTVQ